VGDKWQFVRCRDCCKKEERMATMNVRIFLRCSEDRQSEIALAPIWEIENLLEKHIECLMKQLSGGDVVVEQIIVDRDPLDFIGDDGMRQICP
jgi:hypothetical protein